MDTNYPNDQVLQQIVLRKIFSASFLNSPSLDLSELPISEIPEEIFALENLEILNLENCRITNIQEELFELPNLREVKLDGNPLDLESITYIDKKPSEIRKSLKLKRRNDDFGRDYFFELKTNLPETIKKENLNPVNRANSFLEFTRVIPESPRQIQETIVVVLKPSGQSLLQQSPPIGGIEYLFLLVGAVSTYFFQRVKRIFDTSNKRSLHRAELKEVKDYAFNYKNEDKIKSEIKDILVEGYIEPGVKKIKAYILNYHLSSDINKELMHQMLMIECRYNQVKKEKLSGLITTKEYNSEVLNIIDALIEFTSNL